MMAHVALHAQFLCILIAFYASVLFSSFLGCHYIDESLGHSNSTKTAEPHISPALSYVLYVLHGICLLICCLAMLLNNVSICAKRIPPLLLTILLIFNTCFNIGALVVLGICSRPMEEVISKPDFSLVLRASCLVSAAAVLLCILQIVLSLFCPARKTKKEPEDVVEGKSKTKE